VSVPSIANAGPAVVESPLLPEYRRLRPDWAQGRVRDDSGAALWFLAIFGAFWNLIAWGAFTAFRRSGALAREPFAWFTVIFPLVGLILIGAFAVQLRRRTRFGRSVLELGSAAPLTAGDTLAAAIVAGSALPPGPVRLVLTVLRRTTRGSGKNRSVHEEVLWQETREARGHAERRHDGMRTVVPVSLPLPRGLPVSTVARHGNGILWRLEAEAEVPGADYHATFALPVLLGRAGMDGVPAEIAVTPAGALPVRPDADYRPPADSRVVVRREGAGVVADFPPGRNPEQTRTIAGFWLLWTMVCGLVVAATGPSLFSFVFVAVDVALLLAALRVGLWRSRAAAGPDGLEVRGGFFSLGEPRRLAPSEVAALEVRRGMQAGSAAFFGISAVDHQGRRRAVGGDVRDRREAEWIATALAGALRPSPPVRFTWDRSRG
jgi:hypothetical protein